MIRGFDTPKKNNPGIKPSKKDRIEVARRIANSTDGMAHIKYQEKELLKSPIVKGSVELTYHNIGKQDYIREQLRLIEDKERYDRVKIVEP